MWFHLANEIFLKKKTQHQYHMHIQFSNFYIALVLSFISSNTAHIYKILLNMVFGV